MSTDLTIHEGAISTDLTAEMDYARAISSAAILPQAYRGKPADIMVAVGLGRAMGLTPAEALYRIDVIQGTPAASAELIASNVRKAGHILRVRVDEAAQSVTAVVIRKDDPDYEHTVTRDMAWAEQMGLATKDNYRKQALTMLQWRAISAVARLAASECLYGVSHTADELDDFRPPAPATQSVAKPRGMDAVRAASGAVVVEPAPQVIEADTGEVASAALVRKVNILLKKAGYVTSEDRFGFLSHGTGRQITSSKDLTVTEAEGAIHALEARIDQIQTDAPAGDLLSGSDQ